MTTLAQIESAIDALSVEQKEELLLFLAARLRAERGRLPPPRDLSEEQIRAWMTEDEAEMRELRGGGEE